MLQPKKRKQIDLQIEAIQKNIYILSRRVGARGFVPSVSSRGVGEFLSDIVDNIHTIVSMVS